MASCDTRILIPIIPIDHPTKAHNPVSAGQVQMRVPRLQCDLGKWSNLRVE